MRLSVSLLAIPLGLLPLLHLLISAFQPFFLISLFICPLFAPILLYSSLVLIQHHCSDKVITRYWQKSRTSLVPFWGSLCLLCSLPTAASRDKNPISPSKSHRESLINKAFCRSYADAHVQAGPPLGACSTWPTISLRLMNSGLNRITFYRPIVLSWQ